MCVLITSAVWRNTAMQSQAYLPVLPSSSPCQIRSNFWQHSWWQNGRHYVKIVLTSFTAWPQNQISGKPPISQCEHGNIVKCKFDKTKGACVHQCSSCVFTLNWKQPYNVLSSWCVCSVSDRYVIWFVKQGHYVWTTQIFGLTLM
jgi:hypothetical protein